MKTTNYINGEDQNPGSKEPMIKTPKPSKPSSSIEEGWDGKEGWNGKERAGI